MPTYGNVSSVPLSLAVFLATDNYDYNHDPLTISATSLIKPLRQIILSSRVPADLSAIDLTQMVPLRMGTAIHDAIERSWMVNHVQAMKALGYPDRVIAKVRINPEPGTLGPDDIPIYMEQRAHRKVGKYTISGKFDFVGDGRVEDFKTTSTYTWVNNTNDDKYILQGSLYRWLNPTIVTKDEMAIQFIFTDWSKAKAMQDPKYPQSRIQQKLLPLKSIPETDAFVRRKLQQIEAYWDTPEEEIPHCTDEDLWRSEPVYKYYKDPSKTARSTKNFPTRQEAVLRYIEDGSKGLVKEVPGQATACKYCQAFAVCGQKDSLIASGDLLMA
jgi:hypothetical protein